MVAENPAALFENEPNGVRRAGEILLRATGRRTKGGPRAAD